MSAVLHVLQERAKSRQAEVESAERGRDIRRTANIAAVAGSIEAESVRRRAEEVKRANDARQADTYTHTVTLPDSAMLMSARVLSRGLVDRGYPPAGKTLTRCGCR